MELDGITAFSKENNQVKSGLTLGPAGVLGAVGSFLLQATAQSY